jgi:8-oxo-dGTP pyrophosphatase MutT (NUDIX family)
MIKFCGDNPSRKLSSRIEAEQNFIMSKSKIRSLAVCICREENRLLVEHGYDRITEQRFYRAIGGGIEFGERAEDAARREWMEEFAGELDELKLLGVIENLFTFEGQPGHEIVFVFSGQLRNAGLHATGDIEFFESNGQRHIASWINVTDLINGNVPLYPLGVLKLFQDKAGEQK